MASRSSSHPPNPDSLPPSPGLVELVARLAASAPSLSRDDGRRRVLLYQLPGPSTPAPQKSVCSPIHRVNHRSLVKENPPHCLRLACPDPGPPPKNT